MTKQEYLNIDVDSRSSIVDFMQDRMKYYRRNIQKRKSEEESEWTRAGDITEDMLLEPDTFESKYALSDFKAIPTENMKLLVDDLYNQILKGPDTTFETRFDVAYSRCKYKITKEALLKKFVKEGQPYLEELIANANKVVISTQELENGRRAATALQTTFPQYFIPNVEVDIIPQFTTLFELDGLPLKARMDLIVKNEYTKIITPVDLKITHNVEGFIENYYLKERLDVQDFLYTKALEKEFPDYEIKPFEFIVTDSIGYYRPLRYFSAPEMHDRTYNGFWIGSRYYKGVKRTIEELIWAKEKNIWNVSKVNYKNVNSVSINNFISLIEKRKQ